MDMPIIRLGGPEVINIDFDELSHTYHRYRYELIHLEADFTESDGLFPSDYMQGTINSILIIPCRFRIRNVASP